MGNKDHRHREAKKPPKKKTPVAAVKRPSREGVNLAAIQAVQETIRRNDS